MRCKFLFALAFLVTFGAGMSLAQTATSGPSGAPTPSTGARNPVQGDPGVRTVRPPRRRRPNARTLSREDKQAPGTENGNEPDRASAAGGAR